MTLLLLLLLEELVEKKSTGLGKYQVLQQYSIHYLQIFMHISNFTLAYSHWGVWSITPQVKAGLPATQVWWDHFPLQSCPARGVKHVIFNDITT